MSFLDDTIRQFGHGHRNSRDLGGQIRALRREIDKLTRSTSSHGHDFAEDFGHNASEFIDDALHHGRAAAHQITRQAASATRAVSRDPLPLIVAVGTVALVATILMHRR